MRLSGAALAVMDDLSTLRGALVLGRRERRMNECAAPSASSVHVQPARLDLVCEIEAALDTSKGDDLASVPGRNVASPHLIELDDPPTTYYVELRQPVAFQIL
jgi:hypothetical protein